MGRISAMDVARGGRGPQSPVDRGSAALPLLVIVVGRNNVLKPAPLIERLVADLARGGVPLCRFETFARQTSRFLDERLRAVLPRRAAEWLERPAGTQTALRWAAKTLVLLGHPSRWRYFSHVLSRRSDDVAGDLRAFIRRHTGHAIYLLSHSAGCIAACSVEDEPLVAGHVGFGYPFRHPEHGEEPYRTAVLAGIGKPFLIIQGTRDPYGSLAEAERYQRSPAVRLVAIDADHDFGDVSDPLYAETRALIEAFLGLADPASSPPRAGR